MSKLAILGGAPVISEPLATYRSMGEREREAVIGVIDSGCLSGFYGSPGDEFWGGPQVRAFEAAWCARYKVPHAISFNAASSGLFAAMGAIGISPGDEVIVPPWTMSATAMAPLVYGGIPVFADVEDVTFGLDPEAVRGAVTSRTKAILAVNLFGHPARLDELRFIADQHGLWLVEDNAQAPLGEDSGRPTGTIGDIGVFSLNYHKHIHTGEGGVCVTNDEVLARRLALIRNHGENCADWLGETNLANMIGFNYRLTELSAAVGLVQLAQIDSHVERRERIGRALSQAVADLPGITAPGVREGCRHNYYCWTARYDGESIGADRETFSRALAAEGFPHFTAYVKPLYSLPLFRKKLAIGNDGFPFTLGAPDYASLHCPVAERLHRQEAILFEPCAWDVDDATLQLLAEAIRKVYRNSGDLALINEHGAMPG